MRSIIRAIVAGALALPIVVGAAGIASADTEYEQNHAAATHYGAMVYDQGSAADDDGNAYFYEVWQVAGPDGAGSLLVASWVYDGDAGYYDQYTWSDSHGAWTGSTHATADSPDYHDN
ncbi:hypothetical protein ACRAKI_02815 [Saccharothrix isguenensis]